MVCNRECLFELHEEVLENPNNSFNRSQQQQYQQNRVGLENLPNQQYQPQNNYVNNYNTNSIPYVPVQHNSSSAYSAPQQPYNASSQPQATQRTFSNNSNQSYTPITEQNQQNRGFFPPKNSNLPTVPSGM